MSVNLARCKVARGVNLLDQRMPGWHNKINLNHLSLADTHFCVLGQLFSEQQSQPRWKINHFPSAEASFGHYASLGLDPEEEVCVANYMLGTAVLGLTDEQAEYFGFEQSRFISYEDLDEAWEEVILARANSNSPL